MAYLGDPRYRECRKRANPDECRCQFTRQPRWITINEHELEPIDDSRYSGPFTAHLATGSLFKFNVILQLPITLVDHAFYMNTLYNTRDIPWPSGVLLSFQPVYKGTHTVSCILPTDSAFPQHEIKDKTVRFPRVDPNSNPAELKCYGLASLMFVLYGTPLHVRCLLVSGLKALQTYRGMVPSPIVFDGRLFNGTQIPFVVKYDISKPKLCSDPQRYEFNLKPQLDNSNDEMTVCVACVPVLSRDAGLHGEIREVGSLLGISYGPDCRLNKSVLLDNRSIDGPVVKILQIGRILLSELRRFYECSGVIVGKVVFRSNLAHFPFLQSFVDQRTQRIQSGNPHPWNIYYDDIFHMFDNKIVGFAEVDYQDASQREQWMRLTGVLEEMCQDTNILRRFKHMEQLLHPFYNTTVVEAGSSWEEADAKRSYREFRKKEYLRGYCHRRRYEIIEAQVECSHCLPRGISIFGMCKCGLPLAGPGN
ncbi:hypothetical protein TWF481_006400 [Arthrobotrys musiformis]|uniref:Uncharacterized protein n=1 Tax=Arthrobotrys musiformis TaxID=47236 RepID=A0AAV9WH41_9PEZI